MCARKTRHVVSSPAHARARTHLTRRGAFVVGAAGLLAAAGIGYAGDRVDDDLVGPLRRVVNEATGTCEAPAGQLGCSPEGTNVSGSFYSRYRQRNVGYTVGFPDGHPPGSELPLVTFFHGFRGSHGHAMAGYSPAQAASVRPGGERLTPMAIVTVDGGNGYWHPHPGDDPMGMVRHELIPMLQSRGLGLPRHGVATMGISMGGYGAIIFAEHYPSEFRAVAAISPAIFATYQWAHYVNPGAYWSASDFARYDAISHASALRSTPVRVASGASDPFHPWVEQFTSRLAASDTVVYPPGAHDGAFFYSQIVPSVEFLSRCFA